jgi:phosphopantetheinyl transferase
LTRVDAQSDRSLPAIAIAEAEGIVVAIAARDPRARVGIDVERIPERPGGPEESRFTPGERALLARWSGPARLEWIARFGCAREAAARAAGTALAGEPNTAEVVRADAPSGVLHVRSGTPSTETWSVASARRGEYAWAWTLGGRIEP